MYLQPYFIAVALWGLTLFQGVSKCQTRLSRHIITQAASVIITAKYFLKILLNGGPMSYRLEFYDHMDIPVSILELILILMEVLTYAEHRVSVVEIWLLGQHCHQNLTTAEQSTNKIEPIFPNVMLQNIALLLPCCYIAERRNIFRRTNYHKWCFPWQDYNFLFTVQSQIALKLLQFWFQKI